jgi:dethiobiotin synthetase
VNRRPHRLVVVTGTGTEIGKTFVAAELARELRADDHTVAARKPAQSFDPDDEPTDADVLGAATGEPPDTVCLPHRNYPVAMAPPMAAAALAEPPFTIADLVSELAWPDDVEVGLVEGAGGPRSPLAADGDTVDLCAVLHPDLVVLVADAGLGTVNAVRLSAASLAPHPLVVILNRYDDSDDLHRANAGWLRADTALHIVTSVNALLVHATTR